MNVSDFLGHGAENAIPAATLAAMLQVSPRKLRSSILRERDAGELILYRPGGRGGYFRPSRDPEQAEQEVADVLPCAAGAVLTRTKGYCSRRAFLKNPGVAACGLMIL